jgi:hypothetical protein
MKYLNTLFRFTFALLILVSCANPPEKSDEGNGHKNQPAITNGQAKTKPAGREQVVVAHDDQLPEEKPEETMPPKDVTPVETFSGFSVFEPEGSPGPSGFPAIIFLDAHAKGNLPVLLYHELAEKYGFLLIGSNEIKNGMPGQEVVTSFDRLLKTTKNDYPVNKNRIYLMGFSGGARLGLAFAEAYPEISALVACGAGIQVGVNAPEPTFSFLGMVGNEDFNMIEIINTDRLLNREGFNHAMIIFDGDHNWPPPPVAEEAFQWLDLMAMKDKSKTIDQPEMKSIENWYMQKINSLYEADRIFDSFEVAKRAMEVLDGLTDVSNFRSLTEELRKNPVYNEQLTEMVKTMQMEMGLQNNYMQAFNEKDINWWNSEIQKLNIETVPHTEQLMQKRLLAYLGIMAYMMSDRAVNEKDTRGSEKYLEIYRLLEPTNPEHIYLEAKRRMALNEQTKALEYLRLAVVLGFNDRDRLYNDPVFSSLKDNADFKALME